jgi:hypothetical protein
MYVSLETRHISFFPLLGQKYLQHLQTCTNYELETTFPHIETTLEIFLATHISNASGERYFSVLRREKNMLKEHTVLYEKSPASKALDYDAVIKDIVK